ncbi:MAG: hypothetical protein ACLFVJ_05185 [Persicimonas sp.]
MKTYLSLLTGCAIFALAACAGQPTEPDEEAEPALTEEQAAQEDEAQTVDDLGRVHFDTSCSEQAQPHFERGLAQLHHMWYEKARESFEEAASADDDCAMAYWGVAMTHYTPLWAAPSDEALQRGAQAADRAAELAPDHERERAFIAAIEAYYDDYEQRTTEERTASFRDGWERAYRLDPRDVEAASFYSLAILATVPPITDSTEKQERAGLLLEDVLSREPMHPGGHHYLIHAYDHPELAERAVPIARRYAEIAPDVPHALHMPSHIFTRLGLWQDNAEWNLRSADAAAENPVDGKSSLHFYHALDYVVYAYLQQAKDEQAAEVAERARQADNPQQHLVNGYASAAIPARIALEQRDFEAAANMSSLHPDALAWDSWPYLEAITHATRAVGAIYEDDLQKAQDELDRIEELQAESADLNEPYWAAQADIYHDVVEGLIDYARERPEDALATLREAVQAQDSLQKHPASPGRIIEARDYLGEVLRSEDRPDEALEVYERSLEVTPRRFHALYGAAIAAREDGQDRVARDYYTQLLELTEDGDGDRPELREAREYVDDAIAASTEEAAE